MIHTWRLKLKNMTYHTCSKISNLDPAPPFPLMSIELKMTSSQPDVDKMPSQKSELEHIV